MIPAHGMTYIFVAFRVPPQLDVTNCDIKTDHSSVVSWNIKSGGKRS